MSESAVEMQSPLRGPYAVEPPAAGLAVTPAVNDLVRAQVGALLSSSASWHELSPAARAEMRGNLEKISSYTAALVQEDFALSEQLGQTPVLRSRGALPESSELPLAQAAAGPPPVPPRPAQDEFSSRAADRIGDVTRDTLNAIAFPKFVADLLKGTFNAIVDASIQQMEAFGQLLANVAKTVDQFMADNITDNQARDWMAQQYPGHFYVDLKGGDGHGAGRGHGGARRGGAASSSSGPRLRVRKDADSRSKPNLRGDLKLSGDVSLDDDSAESTLVPAARRKLAGQRHEMLSTMVLMGINRIVVTSGRIYARMGFEIDTSDTGSAESASQFDFKHTTAAAGWFGFGGAASATSVAYVSSTKKGSSDAINVEADLTGEVDLKFKSETFPLERFADMGVISQIQGNTANPSGNAPAPGLPAATTPAPAPATP